MSWYEFKPYVPVGERKAQALLKIKKLTQTGKKLSPVILEGRTIATTFWGKAWCENLESYSDYANRLPRGRSYVRNGLVIDLQIGKGKIEAQVVGSEHYHGHIHIEPLSRQAWETIKAECSGKIDSIVELLRGEFSRSVMAVITRHGEGLFPKPGEIKLDCSCPDWADLCKHLAAVLYGVGARLDTQPELLFLLRGVDHTELITLATSAGVTGVTGSGTLDANLSEVFGIEIAETAPDAVGPVPLSKSKSKPKPGKSLVRRKESIHAPKKARVAKKPVAVKKRSAKKSSTPRKRRSS